MTHRYYKRPWDESRGGAFDAWGRSLWYFEVDDDGYPVRQIEQYENGRVLRYDANHVEDEYGGLGDQPLDLPDFASFEITGKEFAAA
jgi:hypothetical protein